MARLLQLQVLLGGSRLHPASAHGRAELLLVESAGGSPAQPRRTARGLRPPLNRLTAFDGSCPGDGSGREAAGVPGGLEGAGLPGWGRGVGRRDQGEQGEKEGGRGRGKAGGEAGERSSQEKRSVKGEEQKDGLGGRETHREFCNNLNSFQTMSKEPWQHGLKQTLPLIL